MSTINATFIQTVTHTGPEFITKYEEVLEN